MMACVVVAAIVVFLLALLIGRFTLRGKGAPSARLASILVIFIGVWVVIAMRSVSLAGQVAGWLGGGVSELVAGVATFIGDVFT
jgi:hypothetical protein